MVSKYRTLGIFGKCSVFPASSRAAPPELHTNRRIPCHSAGSPTLGLPGAPSPLPLLIGFVDSGSPPVGQTIRTRENEI